MKLETFNIKGLYLIKPKIFYDERGYFFESYNKLKYETQINTEVFVQDDHSYSKNNVLRGLHLQISNPQAQLLYLVTGKLYFVFVDFRPKSKTFLSHTSINLDSDKHYQIYMAPGIGCGFYTLSDNVNLVYKISKMYGEVNEIGIMWNDSDLNIIWPCKNPLVSEKDNNNFYIKDINFDDYKDLREL